MNNQSVKRKIMTSLLPLTTLSDQVNQLLHSLVNFYFLLNNNYFILFVDASWIRDIVVDFENSRIYYSMPSCTILNCNPLVVLNIANTYGDAVYCKEQPYDTESTSFNIPRSLTPSLSYNYNLLVTLSHRTVASYNGSLWTASTTTTTSVLPSCTDNTVTTSFRGTVIY